MSTGKAALLAWTADVLRSSSITTGLSYTLEQGWRGCLMLDSGKTLMLSAKQLRRLADAFEKGGARRNDMGWLVDDMRAMADQVKRKTAARELPADLVDGLRPKGSA